MTRPAISVENLSKAYRIGLKEEIPDTLAGAFTGFLKSPFRNLRQLSRLDTFRHQADDEDIFWALKDVSFEVQEGEVLGVIGRNGAGKSTLLKILSRITEPTSGRAVIRGRVSSLLEVGTGFHPELSGRENVYLNGTILGMTKAEIDRKFDEIVDFSGVGKFLDTPIKRYSSGMKVRLAFAVAAHLEPEILIIDEVLAVGDAEFQKKCLGKMQDVASHGRTVLFVSHDMAAVSFLCSRATLLRDGTTVVTGAPREVINQHLPQHDGTSFFQDGDPAPNRTGDGPFRLLSAQILNARGEQTTTYSYHDTLRVRMTVHTPFLTELAAALSVRTPAGTLLLHLTTRDDNFVCRTSQSLTTVDATIPSLPLNDGRYSITIWIGDGTNIMHDRVPDCLHLTITTPHNGPIRCQAPFRLPADWSTIHRENDGTYSPPHSSAAKSTRS